MYRKLTEQDLEQLKAEIAADPLHSVQEGFDQEFTDPRGQTVVFEDSEGVVLVATFRRELRVTMQFYQVDKERIRKVLREYIPVFFSMFKKMGYIAVTYTTQSKALAWFLHKTGFKTQQVERAVL